MGFDYRVYSDHRNISNWEYNKNYFPIYKSFKLLDDFILGTMVAGKNLVDKMEIAIDSSNLIFNDE